MNHQRSIIERSISYVLIGMILLFAVTSTGNVTEYVHQYHRGWTGVTLGLCFGVTVFTCAYIAATAQRSATRLWAIAIGSIFGIASATFQMNIYIGGGAEPTVAAALSYIPIIAGEVGLAVLEHFYSADNSGTIEQPEPMPLNSAAVTVNNQITVQSAVIAPVKNVQSKQVKQIEQFSVAIEPRTEQEKSFWNMLNEGAQYKITVLARELNVAPNTLRSWRERWNDAQQPAMAGD